MRKNTQTRKTVTTVNGSRPKRDQNILYRNLPAYRGQVVESFRIGLSPTVVTTAIGTGLISFVLAVGPPVIPAFSTRFGNLFEEYRIIKVKVKFNPFSQNNSGLMTHWFDEKNSNVPTNAEAQRISLKSFSASKPQPSSLTWSARDPLDLQYTDTSVTTVSPVSYKLYTDTATFGSNAVATAYGQVTAEIWIQFRGLQ